MISAISPIVSSVTSSAAYAWASAGKQAQSGAVQASSPNSVTSTSGSEKDSAANDSQTNAATGSSADNTAAGKNEGGTSGAEELTPQQQSEVTELKQRDKEVRAHEQAHQSAGAGLTGAASYTYTTGPDGKRYAIGGEVSIDTSPVRNNPSGTIQKMEKVIAAALAPADPSGQDRAVASQANSTIARAQMDLVQQKHSEASAVPGSMINAVA
jgi:hypothetical protein